MKRKVKNTIGVVIMLTTISVIFFWEYWGREQLLYVDVISIKESLKKGDVVEKHNIEYIKIEREKLIKGHIAVPSDIIGKHAKHFIPAFAQLHPLYFNQTVVQSDEMIFRIPNDWLISFPETLRKGDEINILEVNKNYKKEVNMENDESYLLSCKVAFVKDSSNAEITDKTIVEREIATNSIATIELIITENKYEILKKSLYNENKLIIVYK